MLPTRVSMTVDDASKFAGAADPALTGSVEGLVAGDSLGVSCVRTNAAETAGIYRGALTTQYVENPNYAVTVVPGTFITLPAAPVPGEPDAVTPDPVPAPDPTPDPAPSPTTPTTPTPAPAPVVPTPTVPTPAVPTPTPAAAAPTPAAATPTVVTPAPAATPVATTPVNDPEVIEDDATPQAAAPGERTPLAETEEIADEGNPLGAFDEPHCWVHWVMLLGIVVTALYAVAAVRRRLSLTRVGREQAPRQDASGVCG